MAVTYKKLFHLLIDRGIATAELTEQAGFSANILTRLRRDQYVSLESIEKLCFALEIEKALGVSTSTVNRLLRKMAAAGKVKVTGTTKNALYQSTNYGGQNHD